MGGTGIHGKTDEPPAGHTVSPRGASIVAHHASRLWPPDPTRIATLPIVAQNSGTDK